MTDGGRALGHGYDPDGAAVNLGAVPQRDLAPSRCPFGEPWQEDVGDDRRVHLIKTAVQARFVVDVGRALPIVPESPRPARDRFVRHQ